MSASPTAGTSFPRTTRRPPHPPAARGGKQIVAGIDFSFRAPSVRGNARLLRGWTEANELNTLSFFLRRGNTGLAQYPC
jgi:hypothetical protein